MTVTGSPSNTGLVSIVIPAYNAARYLDECLASVRDQTYPWLEVIVVDDGSTDNTRTVAMKHQDEDPRFHVIHRSNEGVSAARNRGVLASCGDYVCFFDADDVMYPHSVACRVEALEAPTPVDIVHADHQMVDSDRNLLRVSRGVPLGDEPLLALLRCPCMGATDVMFRRDALERCGGFDTALTHFEDWDLWLRAAESGLTFRHIPVIVDEYRQHGASASRDFHRGLRSGWRMLEKHRPYWRCRQARRAWRHGRYSLLRHWHWQNWASHPSLTAKLVSLAVGCIRHPPLLPAFPRVVWTRLASSRHTTKQHEPDGLASPAVSSASGG